jgi:release factor glutamine methyltransferase
MFELGEKSLAFTFVQFRVCMTSFKSLFDACVERLMTAGIVQPRKEAASIFAKLIGVSSETILFGDPITINLDDRQIGTIRQAVEKRAERVPVPRLFGEVSFCGMTLMVTDGVYRPYPESEYFVDHVLMQVPQTREPYRILDLGTGTGCLLLALLNAMPEASGVGVDIDENALRLAERNAEENNLAHRAVFQRGNWGEAITEQFDLVVCNPPRVATEDIPHLLPEMRDHEPRHSLDGGSDGLTCFREVANCFTRVTKPQALGAFQVGPKYARPVQLLFQDKGLQNISVKFSYAQDPVGIFVTNEIRKPWWRRLMG